MGYPYYVNVTSEAVFTLEGLLASPIFNLITTPTTDFNEIMLTLDKTHITKASELMDDIPNCNSVARWSAAMQGYEQYIPGLAFTDFDVRVGYPYYVNVTADGTWPDNNVANSRAPAQTLQKNSYAITHSPHAVFGKVECGSIDAPQLHFSAWKSNRPDEKLTDQSKGCFSKSGIWLVQVGNFPSGWKEGDTLCVDFQINYGEPILKEFALSYQPYDEVEKISLQSQSIPLDFVLMQNYPNPFTAKSGSASGRSSKTEIPFTLAAPDDIELTVLNVLGEEITTLVHGHYAAGSHRVVWDARDKDGNLVPSGMYLYRLRTAQFSQTKKMTLMR